MTARLGALLVALALSTSVWAAPGVVDWEYDYVNLREEPATSGQPVGRLVRGAEVEILEESGEWSRVRHAGGEAWVVTRSLKLTEPIATPVEEEIKPVEETAEPAPAEAEPVSDAEGGEPVEEEAAAPTESPVEAQAEPPAAVSVEPARDGKPSGYLSEYVNSDATRPAADPLPSIANMIGGLLVVIGLIVVVALGLKKFFGGKLTGTTGGGGINILATRGIGPKLALSLVEVGGELFLISRSETEARLISRITDPRAIDRLNELHEFAPVPFEEELKRYVVDEPAEPAEDEAGAEEGDSDSAMSAKQRLEALRRQPRFRGRS